MIGHLEQTLRAARGAGRKLLVPYVTGGLPSEGPDGGDWTDAVRAAADAGADAIEIGIPFSDPMMDGPVIQAASERALAAGVTPPAIIDRLRDLDAGVPLAVMTYYNLVFRAGHERFARSLADSGVCGAVLPDLPLDEVTPWSVAADAAGVETIMLAAPTTPDDRLREIADRSRGFVYAVGLLGVTGERRSLADSAVVIARRLKAVTDRPVLVGVGVSSAEQAVEVCNEADGVIIGSAVVRRLLDGEGPSGVAEFVTGVRRALDGG